MKVLMTVCVLLVHPAIAHAQEQVIYREDFSDVDCRWPTDTLEDLEVYIQDNVYSIRQDREDDVRNYFVEVFIDPDVDYEIETRIRQTGGSKYFGFGILWGSANGPNHNAFHISTGGFTRCHRYNKGRYRELVKWKKVKGISEFGEFNVISLRKYGRDILCRVNGRTVSVLPISTFLGNQVGIQVSGDIDVDVDYFLVRQNRPEMPVAEGKLHRENLGPNVNSIYDELNPVISTDGKTLYFSRLGHPENAGARRLDDIWRSRMQADGAWGPAERMPKPLNNDDANFVVSVSPDGNTLLLGNAYNNFNRRVGKGFAISHFTSEGWTTPEAVNIENYYNYNQYVEACLSADGGAILITVERNDSYGIRDIYVSLKQPEGVWSSPKNLGKPISTYADEASPFLAADGTTLYFSTSGKAGYGDDDVFVTRRLDSTWRNWSEPINLGPDINTAHFDAYYSAPASGEYAYMTTIADSTGHNDIYRIKLPQKARPNPTVLVSGNVYNSATGEPMEAEVVYESLNSGKTLGVARSHPQTGYYQIVLPAGEKFGFRAKVPDFYPESDNFNTVELQAYDETAVDLYLHPVEVGRPIRLNNIFFEFGKWELQPESFPDLNRLVEYLQTNLVAELEIAGHTDNVGGVRDNLQLSQNRAQAVVDYLQNHGIERTRIQAKGYGESKPVEDNTSEEGRSRNRRVEFVILQ